MFSRLVVITRPTRLDDLVRRFNTRAQAAFVVERAGRDFAGYVAEHEAYQRSLDAVLRASEVGLRVQRLERTLVATFVFAPTDVVITVGPDGLVANAAKYVGGQPILGVNPDPARVDGVLATIAPARLPAALDATLQGRAAVRAVTMAEARLADGQRLLGFNDLFVGAASHVSARYSIRHDATVERHSSSGVLISTGAGSSGWLSSVFHEMRGVLAFCGDGRLAPPALAWEDRQLVFAVREPFRSRQSDVTLVMGTIDEGRPLHLDSEMPSGGVIFSDGVEDDRLAFNAGASVRVGVAPERAMLVA
jgi:hypothetical protein